MYACTSCTVVSIVDNMCEFQHSASHVDCNFDARLVSKTRKYRSTKQLRKHVCQQILVSNNSKRPSLVNCISTNPECRSDYRWPVYKHSLVVSALSVIARLWALKFSPSGAVSQCSQIFALHLVIALHLAIALLLAIGFTQLAHPSRCSRSTLTTVCFCAGVSLGLCVHIGFATPSPDPS